ncbi:predicted protein [Chaetomium globosum CBS 148.51]|uniref:Uncharacterized protein n=1 Tax=Chaetomium globosum (strain ATCC 6205 / CBS 148.51 / DSM 1962 / NBRC 6347 / NRRL 1970) TaxID=306901 RepID=Q2H5J2_CHAGB|nr:uncharacterized protein CHGG_06073 [Chaetomium globosum CBS 148.51]EAQ89454.1 predicted protein [Chaetomium globosum CBS 148.51]
MAQHNLAWWTFRQSTREPGGGIGPTGSAYTKQNPKICEALIISLALQVHGDGTSDNYTSKHSAKNSAFPAPPEAS